MKKYKRSLAILIMTAGMLAALSSIGFAFTGETAQTETVPETETSVVIEEETASETEATPFVVPGNGELTDDKANDDTKQFITVQTKNGNTFFLVLDRSRNAENAYMLSMIDENDLADFIEENQMEPETEKPQVVIPETEEKLETESETEKKQQLENGTTNTSLIVIIVLGIGICSIYYLKVIKPKKTEEDADDENLEFYDGGAYINEDQTEEARKTNY